MNASNQFPIFRLKQSAEGKGHPFLVDMGPHQRRLLEDAAKRIHFRPGEIIFCEGEPADGLYLIQEGTVQLEAFTRDKGLVPVQALGAGDVMGWSWLFPPCFRHFGARALEATDALFISGVPLRNECESDHDFGYELMKRLTQIILKRLQATRTQQVGNWEMKNPAMRGLIA
jgi:CRP-like cAMP-binding protein